MRPLLAIDTADQTAGVAVLIDGIVVAEFVETSAYRHSERLFALVDEALTGSGCRRKDLSAVAVTVGPGSFTGLRVGVATAKGIAFALDLPVVGVSTLAALALGAQPFPGTILPMLDARKRQMYGAAVDGRDGRRLLEEGAWDPRAFALRAEGLSGPYLALGSGLSAYRELLEHVLGPELLCASPAHWRIAPGQVALLAAAALAEGGAVAPAALTPVYLRRSEAEEAKMRRAAR